MTVADAMLHGVLCVQCGGDLGEDADSEAGMPIQCRECRARSMNKLEREQAAEAEFEEARVLAASVGLRLVRRHSNQYQLSHPRRRWLLNIYPTNCRLYYDKNRPKGPYLDFAGVRWTLLDVVRAAVEQERGA